MDRLCNRIVGGKKNVLVAFGAALPSQGFGYAGKPLRLLRRQLAMRCRVVILDEHYTSQVCSGCGHRQGATRQQCKLSPARARKVENGRQKELFEVRFCKGCNKFWHRDVNAARNMRLVLEEIISASPGCVRPRAFLHAGTVTPQSADGTRSCVIFSIFLVVRVFCLLVWCRAQPSPSARFQGR